jgi:hypothetical protein
MIPSFNQYLSGDGKDDVLEEYSKGMLLRKIQKKCSKRNVVDILMYSRIINNGSISRTTDQSQGNRRTVTPATTHEETSARSSKVLSSLLNRFLPRLIIPEEVKEGKRRQEMFLNDATVSTALT